MTARMALMVRLFVIDSYEDVANDPSTDLDVATVFARELGLDGAQAWDDILLIEDLLVRARLPIEVLAIAFNILSKLVKQTAMDSTLQSPSLDLLVISTLSLAAIYTNDHPPSSSHWSRNVALGTATAKQIDAASMAIMEALDWRIHSCSEDVAVVAALQLFERRGVPTAVSTSAQEIYEEPCLKPQPLSLNLTGRSSSGEARWDNGQLTPTTPSACSELEEFRAVFLPLL